MKSSPYRLAAALALVASVGLAPLSAATITLDVSNLLGWVDPSNPNNEATALAQTKFFVDAYNLGTAEGTSLGNNPNDSGTEANVLYRPDAAPAMLATPLAGVKVDTDNPVVDLGGFTYQYVLFKQNTSAWIYYIGNLVGPDISINWGGNPLTAVDDPNETGVEISHYVLFNKSGTPTQHRVPDGGTTVLLVGAGLLLTAFTVRRKNAA